MEHDLPEILDGADEPVTVEELEGVVRRAGQRRRASLAAGAAGLLAVGAFGGAAVSWGGAGPTGYAADQPDPLAAKKAEMAGMARVEGGSKMFAMGLTPNPLFRREANGVAIRAYRLAPPAGQEGPCAPKPVIQAQLSNAAAVSIGTALDVDGDAFGALGHAYIGTEEKEPATWVAVQAPPGVATVRFTAGGATDSMAPQNGIAVLVVPGTGLTGTVDALGPDGAVIQTVDYTSFVDPSIMYGAPDPSCVPQDCVGWVGPAPTTTGPAGGPEGAAVPTATPAPCGPCGGASPGQVEQVKEALAEVEAKVDDPAARTDVAASRAKLEACLAPAAPGISVPEGPGATTAPAPPDVPVTSTTAAAAPPTTAAAAAP